MVIKFDPEGRVLMTMGTEAGSDARSRRTRQPAPAAGGRRRRGRCRRTRQRRRSGWHRRARRQLQPARPMWRGMRPGNIYVADGYGNSRIAKFDSNGKYLKSWGSRGSAPGQFNIPHTLAIDAQGLVYVGDRANNRIQVFDGEGTFKTQFVNVGAPSAICITPGPRQFLYASNSNPSTSMDNGEIYKMSLDGKIVGKFGTAGKLLKEFGSVHEMDCRSENELYVGEITNWRVQKLTLKPR